MSLDLEHSQASNAVTPSATSTFQKSVMDQGEGSIRNSTSGQGLIDNIAALIQPANE
jgi:hypothetical protein